MVCDPSTSIVRWEVEIGESPEAQRVAVLCTQLKNNSSCLRRCKEDVAPDLHVCAVASHMCLTHTQE